MSLLGMCIFHQHSVFGLLVSNRGLKRKELWIDWTFFYAIAFGVNGQLIQASNLKRKDVIEFSVACVP